MENKFDYGATVIILSSAPKKYHPSEIGFICGMIEIDSDESAVARAWKPHAHVPGVTNSDGTPWLPIY